MPHPRCVPPPCAAPSYSRWACCPTTDSGQTSTLPWHSSRPLRRELRRGLHSTYPPLCVTPCARVSRTVSRDAPPVGHTRLLWVAAPRTGAVLPLRPRPRESREPKQLTRSVGRPRVDLCSHTMDFVSLHHGHTRGTLCFSLAPRPLAAASAIVRCSRNPSTMPLLMCLAAAGHPLPSRYSVPWPNTPRRPRTPPPQLLKILEARPSAGGHFPCS